MMLITRPYTYLVALFGGDLRFQLYLATHIDLFDNLDILTLSLDILLMFMLKHGIIWMFLNILICLFGVCVCLVAPIPRVRARIYNDLGDYNGYSAILVTFS